jgi:hypothetical protein
MHFLRKKTYFFAFTAHKLLKNALCKKCEKRVFFVFFGVFHVFFSFLLIFAFFAFFFIFLHFTPVHIFYKSSTFLKKIRKSAKKNRVAKKYGFFYSFFQPFFSTFFPLLAHKLFKFLKKYGKLNIEKTPKNTQKRAKIRVLFAKKGVFYEIATF